MQAKDPFGNPVWQNRYAEKNIKFDSLNINYDAGI